MLSKREEQIRLVENDINTRLSRPERLSPEQRKKLQNLAESFSERKKLKDPKTAKKSTDAKKTPAEKKKSNSAPANGGR